MILNPKPKTQNPRNAESSLHGLQGPYTLNRFCLESSLVGERSASF